MSEKLIIGPDRFNCPICATEWYEHDLSHIDTYGCPGCGRKFNLENYLHKDEVLYHDWRETCYHRMIQDRENGGKI